MTGQVTDPDEGIERFAVMAASASQEWLVRATTLWPDELPDYNRSRLATFANIHGISRRVAHQGTHLAAGLAC